MGKNLSRRSSSSSSGSGNTPTTKGIVHGGKGGNNKKQNPPPPPPAKPDPVPGAPKADADVPHPAKGKVSVPRGKWFGIQGQQGRNLLGTSDHSPPCIYVGTNGNMFMEAAAAMQFSSNNSLTVTVGLRELICKFYDRSVATSETVHIAGNNTSRVSGNHTTEVVTEHSLNIGIDQTVIAGTGQQIDITGDKLLTITGGLSEIVNGNETREITGHWASVFNSEFDITVFGDWFEVKGSTETSLNFAAKASAELSLEASATIGFSDTVNAGGHKEKAFALKMKSEIAGKDSKKLGIHMEEDLSTSYTTGAAQKKDEAGVSKESGQKKSEKSAVAKTDGSAGIH